MPRFSFQPLGDSWALALIAIAALVVGLLCLTPKDAGVSIVRRRVELGLRFAVVALFAVFFTRPAVVSTEKEELPASVVFLCDESESMSIRDGENDASRYETMKKLFADAGDKFRALCEKFDVRVVGFGESTEEIAIDDGVVQFPDEPQEQESKLGDALLETLRATAGKRLLGVALLSDGSQRALDAEAISPQDAALRLRDAERPIYAAPLGSAEATASTRDVAVQDLRANDRVFLGNELAVSGQVRVVGYENASIPLTLSLETESGESEVVDQTTLEPQTSDATLSYQFKCKPETAGEWKITVAAAVQDHELVETNNELGSFVEVLDRGVDVLYIEGTRRYEQNFIRGALDSTSDVRIKYWRPPTTSLVAKSPNKTEAEMVAEYTKSRKSFEKTFFGEGKYATYVLGDVDATAFQPNELKALAQRVEEGAGLVVLAGERSLSLGGYADTPLAKALPVQTFASDRLPLESDLSTQDANSEQDQRSRYEGQFAAEPDLGKGKDDFIIRMSLDAQKNADIWKNMPALSAVYRLGKLKPNASTLLTARRLTDHGKPQPLLVTQRYGSGRVVVLATDSTWRWRMRGKGAEHAKFWRQLLLWSAKFDEIMEGELAVELERSRFAPGEEVDFRAVYRPKPGENLDDMTIRSTIVAPEGTRETIETTEEEGQWRGQTRKTTEPGDYTIEAELVSKDGETLQTSRARFLVFAQNLELERPQADPSVLENLAATSGGKTIQASEFGAFLDELLQQRETIADYREVKRTLYDKQAIFWLFVAIMTLNWILRKRWGMV